MRQRSALAHGDGCRSTPRPRLHLRAPGSRRDERGPGAHRIAGRGGDCCGSPGGLPTSLAGGACVQAVEERAWHRPASGARPRRDTKLALLTPDPGSAGRWSRPPCFLMAPACGLRQAGSSIIRHICDPPCRRATLARSPAPLAPLPPDRQHRVLVIGGGGRSATWTYRRSVDEAERDRRPTRARPRAATRTWGHFHQAWSGVRRG